MGCAICGPSLVEEIDTLTARNDVLTKKLAQAAELADMGRLTELRDFLTAMNQEAPDT